MLLSMMIFTAVGFAQEGIVKNRYSGDSIVTFRVYDTRIIKIDTSSAREHLMELLQAGPGDDLVLMGSQTDDLGYTHYSYQQYYKGMKVDNGEYFVHAKDELIRSVNGNFIRVGDVDTKAILTESEALQKAIETIGAKEYMWQVKGEEQSINERTGESTSTYYPKGELVVVYSESIKSYRLAYKFNIIAQNPISIDDVFLDAITGKVIWIQNLIYYDNYPVSSTANTRYSENKTITTEYDTDDFLFHLRETRESVPIATFDISGGEFFGFAPDFTNDSIDWIDVPYEDLGEDQHALDAHWGAEKVYDYWKTERERNSYDDSGSAISSYVHFYFIEGDDNAGWYPIEDVMVFGDGETECYPLTSLDVVAHEFAHGVSWYVGFGPNKLEVETYALNEGMSDIWAACVEEWAAPEKDHWLAGEEIMKNGFSCLRSHRSPNTEGHRYGYATEGHYPDTYKGTYWYYGTDTVNYSHTNCTVFSHWFYLLAHGGSGTNDFNNSYDVTSIGIDDAAEIVWQALHTHKFLGTTTFSLARDGTIEAATELNDGDPVACAVSAVTSAWYAVGVGESISGPSYICSSGNSFYVDNLESGQSVSWDQSYNISRVSAQGSNPCTFEPVYSTAGTGWIKARILTGCGDFGEIKKSVVVNPPLPQDIELTVYQGYELIPGYGSVWFLEPNTQYYMDLDYNNTLGCSISNIDYNLPPSFTIIYENGNYVYFRTPSTSSGYSFSVDAQTCCGVTQEVKSGYFVVGYGMYSMIFSPNPTTGETTVTLADKNGDISETVEWDMEVYALGQLLTAKKERIQGRQYILNVSGWKKGVYIVKAKVGDEVVVGKLVVE